mmetsp:Transcript_9185/g.22527  ORF Transcript_9185/g.22527 Transcript_9185/m.22527 type:complete len:347 (+) Transcript_9185:76-1116(+)
MASFYNTTNIPGNDDQVGGNYDAAGYDNGSSMSNDNVRESGFQQFQQQQQQQPQPQQINVQQWKAQPQGQSYGRPAQQELQQQQQSAQPFWMPGVQQAATQAAAGFIAGNLSSDQVLTKGMDEIGKAFGGGIPGMNYIMNVLRSYFAVDNNYVKRKMLKVLFPFTNKQWMRQQVDGPQVVNYALPISDENAPDLYLPIMSLITYCLLSAFLYGTAGQFNPEVIADVISKCFVTQFIEVLVTRGCLFMMQAPMPFLDIFSYTGYKYLGLTVSMLCGIVFKHLEWGTASFYATFLWTASAAAWFMMKTMTYNIPLETASTGPKRDIMVLAFSASQVATMWFVSQTKYL